MKRIAWSAGLALALTVGTIGARADDGPGEMEMPKPQKEHEWLQQLVGEWTTEGEMFMDPSQPPLKTKGTEQSRMVGGFWATFEHKGDFMGTPFTGILTLGYDPGTKRYVGTWIDSMSSVLWRYEGSVDASGKVLTLEAEGPSFEKPGETCRFRESIEVKGPDHKVFTSKMEVDGQWVTTMVMHYHRKK